MKRFSLLLLICSLSTVYSFGQDMSGEWNGVLRQSEGGAATSYYFKLNLKQKGNVITGKSKVSFVNEPNNFAIMELKGTFKDDILTFKETKIVEQHVMDGLVWCLKMAKLNFTIKKDGFCIEGTWSGKADDGTICPPGTLKICKIVPMAYRSKKSDNDESKQRTYATLQTQRYFKFRETFPNEFNQQSKRFQIG